jgi:putative dimethyl sulfoxide reductase chaperone
MNTELAIRYAQVYLFLSGAFLYPQQNWGEDAQLLPGILQDLGLSPTSVSIEPVDLARLQAAHRRTFGLAGSLCYETEYGLPHEFRQSQEMADICGFYRAFGFNVGGQHRERPDHLAVELEFMYVLALKAAYAVANGAPEHVEVCLAAQSKFLRDHLGRWISLFARSVELNGVEPYLALAQFTDVFVHHHAHQLGAPVEATPTEEPVKPTPFDPDFSCAGCAVAELELSRR